MTFAWRHRRNPIAKRLRRKSRAKFGPKLLRYRPMLEWLEDRTVPALFIVNTTADTQAYILPTGQDALGNISLRSALMAANDNPGPDTIQLPEGLFSLTLGGTGENSAATGDLDIRDSLTLIGSGASTTRIDAGTLDRVFEIISGVNVTMQNLTISGGRVTGVGGGIANAGNLTLTGTVISDNSALGQNGTASLSGPGVGGSVNGFGGGVYNSGTLTIINSTFDNNTAQGGNGGSNSSYGSGGGGGGLGAGGGLYNNGGFVTILGSTFTSNDAIGGNGAVGGPGGFVQGFGGGGGGDGGDGGNAGLGATSGTSGSFGGGGGGGGSGGGVSNGGNGGLGGFGGGGGGGGSAQGSFSAGALGSGGFGAGDGGFGGKAPSGFTGGGGGGGGGGLGAGGAIFSNSGTVIISNSTITGNTARGGNGGDVEPAGFGKGGDGGDGMGGGLFARNSSVQVQNSTVTGNSTSGGDGGDSDAYGGGGGNFTPGNPGAGYSIDLSIGEQGTVVEGNYVDLFGSFSALIPGQSHTVIINWGDGSQNTTLNLGASEPYFYASHFYDDIPLQGLGYLPITVQIINSSGLQTVGGMSVLVENVPPTAELTNDGPVLEGNSAVVSFVEQIDPSQADTVAGFTYSYDFNNDGYFEIVDSTSATATVPAEYLTNGPGQQIVVGRIRDKDGGFTDCQTMIKIEDVPPELTTPEEVIIGVGQTEIGTGSFVDSGVESWLVEVNYGDGSELVYVPFDENKSFVLSHAYASEGTYTVTVTVSEIEGASDEETFTIYVLPAPPLDTDIGYTDRNGVATATIPGQITATLVLPAPTRPPAAIIVSVLPNDAVEGTGTLVTVGVSNPDGTVTLKTYDVRVINASPLAQVTVTFLVESPSGQTPVLEFIDPKTGVLRSVQGSTRVSPSYTVQRVPGTNTFAFTIVIDNTSSPTTAELFGTVFTFTGPQGPPSAPLPNLPNLLIQANSQATFVSNTPSANTGGVPTTGFLSGTESRFVVSSSTSLTASSGAGSENEEEQDPTVVQTLRWINDIHMASWANMEQNQANKNPATPQEEQNPPESNDPNNSPPQDRDPEEESNDSEEPSQEGHPSLMFAPGALERLFEEMNQQETGDFDEPETAGTFDVFDALEDLNWIASERINPSANLLWSFIPLALGTLVPLHATQKTHTRKIYLAPMKGKRCFPAW